MTIALCVAPAGFVIGDFADFATDAAVSVTTASIDRVFSVAAIGVCSVCTFSAKTTNCKPREDSFESETLF